VKLFGYSPSKIWRKFGKKEIASFKKAYEELIAVLDKEKNNE
jgi:hypothetical protein